jgi:hypothetical protein
MSMSVHTALIIPLFPVPHHTNGSSPPHHGSAPSAQEARSPHEDLEERVHKHHERFEGIFNIWLYRDTGGINGMLKKSN